MAIFHASLRVLCRKNGESSVAAAAYRAGTVLRDSRIGLTQDYSRKLGVLDVAVLAPPDAPPWAFDIQALWEAVEIHETRINARLARELVVSLPHELDPDTRSTLARDLAQVLVDRYHVAVQLAVHAPDRQSDDRNHHVHLLFTTRALNADGFGAKTRVLDEPKTGPGEVTWLRRKVAELTNRALTAAGSHERVDHRTLRAQAAEAEAAGDFVRAAALTRQPTKYQGRAATAASRRGQFVQVVADNRAKQRSHRRAFSAFLLQANATSHPLAALVRPRRVRRAPPERVPRAPAAILPRPYRDSGIRRRSEYLKGLHATLRDGKKWLESYVKIVKERAALEAWLARAENGRAWEAFMQGVETHREIRRAHAKARAQTRRWRHAAIHHRRKQHAIAVHRAAHPGARHLGRSSSVRQERQALWRTLRAAVAAEKEARRTCREADLEARREIVRLRRQLATFEQMLRQRALNRTAGHAASPRPVASLAAPTPFSTKQRSP